MRTLNIVFYITSFYCFYTLCATAQTPDSSLIRCRYTPLDDSSRMEQPWYGNNGYLYQLLDSLGYDEAFDPFPEQVSKTRINWANLPNEIPDCDVRIPVQFHIHDNVQGIRGPQELYLRNEMDRLNFFFSGGIINSSMLNDNTGPFQSELIESTWNPINQPIMGGNNTRILFYQVCQTQYRYNDQDAAIRHDSDALRLNRDYSINGLLNVHFPLVFNVDGTSAAFYPAPFYIDEPPFIIITHDANFHINRPNSLAHEVGHFFGLDHTHLRFDGQKCGQEAVSRTRRHKLKPECPWKVSKRVCDVNGDDLCDTPADRDDWNWHSDCTQLTTQGGNRVCTFTNCGHWQDLWGDSHANIPPDPYNLMSYFDQQCRRQFSWGQIGVMRHYVHRRRYDVSASIRGDYDFNAYRFDRYEPDNSFRTARLLNVNTPQHHSFHWQKRFYVSPVDCDEDWVQFVVPAGGQLLAITTEQARHHTPDTRIELYAANGTTLLAADDGSNGNGLSRLTEQNLAAGRYFLRVTKHSPLPATDISNYYLYVRECIPLNFCYSDTVLSGQQKHYAALEVLTVPCPNERFEVQANGFASFKAGERIAIRPGFRALAGCTLSARIVTPLTCADNRTVVFGKQEALPPYWPVTPVQLPQSTSPPFPGAVAYARSLGLLDDRETGEAEASTRFTLYPIPHEQSFAVSFDLPAAGPVRLSLIDVAGREVLTLYAGELSPGTQVLHFAPDLPAGVYVCRIEAAGLRQHHPLVRTR